MIEVAYVEGPGIILSLGRSESGGWERNGKQLPWCGVLGHQHDGLSGFKVFAGDWIFGVYALDAGPWATLFPRLIAIAAVMALLLFLAGGCASAPDPAPPPLPPILIPADCDDVPIVTSTPTNNGGACAAIREAWAIQRDTAVRWRGIAAKRKATIDQLSADLADTRDELARAHVRLVESPPPAPDRGSALLGILLPFGGAALGGGAAALACSEAGCSTAGTALASAGAAGLLAALGAWLAGLSP